MSSKGYSAGLTRWQSIGVLLLLTALLAFAQAPDPQGQFPQGPQGQMPPPGAQGPDDGGDNGPGRGVARISVITGDVLVRRGDSGDWIAAVPNAPIVVQDRIQAGANSRAEVQMNRSNIVRLGQNAEIRFSELDQRIGIQVASGTVTYRVLRELDADVEVSTPNVALRPTRRGVYRFTVLPDGTTEITVRSGEAEILTQKGSEHLAAGRTMWVRGTSTDPEFQLANATPRDEWDQWNESRDRELERANSNRYVSSSIYGAEDLDRSGHWENDPPYGNVWAPDVGPDWAPYRNGRWSWIDYYGWSWVSYDPWGWAPYHYGRWYHGPRGWCWWPGAIGVRHSWSPGLVAWVGFGGGVGLGFGNVGWIPLAPYEPFHPWYGWGAYRGGGRYGANIVGNVNVTNIYRNARVNNGMTAVRSSDFASGHVNNVRMSATDLQRGSLMRGQLPIAPERASQRLSDRQSSMTPRSNDHASFYSRRPTTASSSPVPFQQQQRNVQDLSRRAFSGSAGNTAGGSNGLGSRPGMPNSSGAATGRAADRQMNSSQSGDRGGWRRFGDPSNAGTASARSGTGAAGQAQQSTDRGGWRRFGDPGSNSGDSMSRGRQPAANPGASSTRRFGEQGGAYSTPQRQSNPSMQSPPVRRGNQAYGEPLRLNPSIVRERPQGNSAPSYGGGGGSVAPSRPSYSAPSYQGGGSRGGSAGPSGSGSHSGGGGGRSSSGSHGGRGR